MLANRLAVIERLKVSTELENSTAERLKEAQKARALDYREALDAGWSEAELSELGFPEPTAKLPGRPRKRAAARKPGKSAAASAPGSGPSGPESAPGSPSGPPAPRGAEPDPASAAGASS